MVKTAKHNYGKSESELCLKKISVITAAQNEVALS